jgi:hypothetical protein
VSHIIGFDEDSHSSESAELLSDFTLISLGAFDLSDSFLELLE